MYLRIFILSQYFLFIYYLEQNNAIIIDLSTKEY